MIELRLDTGKRMPLTRHDAATLLNLHRHRVRGAPLLSRLCLGLYRLRGVGVISIVKDLS